MNVDVRGTALLELLEANEFKSLAQLAWAENPLEWLGGVSLLTSEIAVLNRVIRTATDVAKQRSSAVAPVHCEITSQAEGACRRGLPLP